MKLQFIRHADPIYETDSLTESGVREAEALRDYLKNKDLGYIYVSPLNRTKKTAEIALGSLENTTVCSWLREFKPDLDLNKSAELQKAYHPVSNEDGSYPLRETWDMLPAYYHQHPVIQNSEHWKESMLSEYSNHVEQYDWVIREFDELLAKHGYQREGRYYKAINANHDSLTFFCHFGVTSVLLSHLMNLSPYALLQNICIPPTGISVSVTEEREKGIAIFRTIQIGSTPHLLQPSFNGRFAEVFEDEERH